MNHRTTTFRLVSWGVLALLVVAAPLGCGDDEDDADAGLGSLVDAGEDAVSDDADADTGVPDTGSDARDVEPDVDEDEDAGGDTGDECTHRASPSFGIGETLDMSGMTAEHNKWRLRVGVAPLSWNTTLAASSKDYAERCVWEHSDDRSPDADYERVGENLAYTSQRLSAFGIEAVVDLWADERYDWHFGMNVGDGTLSKYGHYTQMVWHSTVQVGCGAAYCANVDGIGNSGTVIVCRYGPAGNYTGEPPYDEKSGECLDLDNDDVLQRDDPDDTDRTIPE